MTDDPIENPFLCTLVLIIFIVFNIIYIISYFKNPY